MIDYPQILLLGAVAGFTIFLGLPLAIFQGISQRKKSFLNAIAIGILIFLTVDVFSHAWKAATDSASAAFVGKAPFANVLLNLFVMFGGIAVGLLGLTWYESHYMKEKSGNNRVSHAGAGGGGKTSTGRQQLQLLTQVNAYKLSMMIAIGIGAHNLGEGLAIGQSYASGSVGLALILIIGFAAHNATEGFGIAGPLTGLSKRPSLSFVALAGLIGGGPTFVGTLVGSLWSSTLAYIFFLAIAGGSLIYVSMLMYNSARRQTTNLVLMFGFFVGLVAGFGTDLLLILGGA